MGNAVKGFVQYGLEAAYTPGGTLPVAVAAKHILPYSEAKFDLDKKFDEPDERRNSYAQYFSNAIQPLTKLGQWSLKGRYYPDTCLGLFALVVHDTPGVVNTAAAAPNPAYVTWTWTTDDTHELRSATFEQMDGTESWRIPNCFGTKLEIDWSADKELTYSLSGYGLDMLQHAMTSALPQPTEIPHNGMSAKVFLDAAGGTPGTTQMFDLLTGKITIETSAKGIYTAQNSGTYARTYRGKRKISVDLDLDFSSAMDTEFQQQFLTANKRYFSVLFNGPLLPGGSGGATKAYQLQFNVPLYYKTWTRDTSKENTTAKVKGQAIYDPTLAYDLQVVAQVASADTALTIY